MSMCITMYMILWLVSELLVIFGLRGCVVGCSCKPKITYIHVVVVVVVYVVVVVERVYVIKPGRELFALVR